MKLTVTKYLNVRVGKPSVNAPCYQYLAPGSELEVDGQLYPGDKYEGIDIWMKDEAGNYYWSGGVSDPSTHVDDSTIKYPAEFPTQIINWNQAIANIPNEWIVSRGKDIQIAILDTGINTQHVDLRGSLVGLKDCTETNGSAQDRVGHGSHMAGVVAARSDRARGVMGVAPQAKIYSVKIMHEAKNNNSDSWLVAGIEWARKQQVNIISLSMNIDQKLVTQNLYDEIQGANNEGILIIAAAGDNTEITKNQINCPADYTECISVGTLNNKCVKQGRLKFNSMLDFISPLFDFWSCGMNDVVPYTLQQGCSVATAFMSGIVALMLSALKTSNVDIRKLSKSFVCAELNKYSTKMSNADFGDFEKFIYINPFN